MRVQNRGTFSYQEDVQIAQYCLFDLVNNKKEDVVTITGTKEECLQQYGLAQKEYYIKYPRLLPKGIAISQGSVHKKSFQVYVRFPNRTSTVSLGNLDTIQEAIQAKRDFIAYNIE